MDRPSSSDAAAAVASLCRALGLGPGLGTTAPVLLAAAHHHLFLLPSLGIVARVQGDGATHANRERARREVAMTRHLARRGAPVLAPCATLAGPHVVPPFVVTFWPHVDHYRVAGEADAAPVAAALDAVHRAMRDHDASLPPYTMALDRCRGVLTGGDTPLALARNDRTLLLDALDRRRAALQAIGAPSVPLHGDAHPGNCLIGADGPLWLDFEEVCMGPREYDIACLPADAWPLFADVDPALITLCAELKSICVATWCAAARAPDATVREAADHHLAVVRAWAR